MFSPDAKVRIQNFGRFLSNMVMPNIGAFIAWGIITALFIPTGWLPNETLAKLVGPMITYLLPLLIGFTGGRLVGGDRGGVEPPVQPRLRTHQRDPPCDRHRASSWLADLV